jgi:hypothetical protein
MDLFARLPPGIVIAIMPGMAKIVARQTTTLTPPAEPARVLHWVFVKGTKALTCEIRVNAARSHDVCVVPHWDVSCAMVQRFDRAAQAVWRHAEIARRFQDDGWALVRQRPVPHVQPAC